MARLLSVGLGAHVILTKIHLKHTILTYHYHLEPWSIASVKWYASAATILLLMQLKISVSIQYFSRKVSQPEYGPMITGDTGFPVFLFALLNWWTRGFEPVCTFFFRFVFFFNLVTLSVSGRSRTNGHGLEMEVSPEDLNRTKLLRSTNSTRNYFVCCEFFLCANARLRSDVWASEASVRRASWNWKGDGSRMPITTLAPTQCGAEALSPAVYLLLGATSFWPLCSTCDKVGWGDQSWS